MAGAYGLGGGGAFAVAAVEMGEGGKFAVEMGGGGTYAVEMSGTNNYPVEMGEGGAFPVEMGAGGDAGRYSSELEGTPEENDFW